MQIWVFGVVLCMSEARSTRSRALLASALTKALWLEDRFASDVSGSYLSNIMTRRISSARVCVKVLQSFSSRASVSTKRATWGRLGLAGACPRLAAKVLYVLHTPTKYLSWIWRQKNRQAASFVLGIHFNYSYFCDSRSPFGQIDNRKHVLGRIWSHFGQIIDPWT